MNNSVRLPAHFPLGSKYVLESCGSFVRRYVEFPNGRRIRLSRRKALPCEGWELQQLSIVPNQPATPVAKNERGSRLKERVG
jgi:hypothetical protein